HQAQDAPAADVRPRQARPTAGAAGRTDSGDVTCTKPAPEPKLHADKAYDHRRCRRALTRRGIQPRIARRGIESSARLGRHRWVVERTLAWFGQFRRLAIRYERRADIHAAFLTLASAMIAWRFVQRWFC
ncbi:transposase, partial [Paracraurococcus ruber]